MMVIKETLDLEGGAYLLADQVADRDLIAQVGSLPVGLNVQVSVDCLVLSRQSTDPLDKRVEVMVQLEAEPMSPAVRSFYRDRGTGWPYSEWRSIEVAGDSLELRELGGALISRLPTSPCKHEVIWNARVDEPGEPNGPEEEHLILVWPTAVGIRRAPPTVTSNELTPPLLRDGDALEVDVLALDGMYMLTTLSRLTSDAPLPAPGKDHRVALEANGDVVYVNKLGEDEELKLKVIYFKGRPDPWLAKYGGEDLAECEVHAHGRLQVWTQDAVELAAVTPESGDFRVALLRLNPTAGEVGPEVHTMAVWPAPLADVPG